MARIVRIPESFQPKLSAALLDSLRYLAAQNHQSVTSALLDRYRRARTDPALLLLKQRHQRLKKEFLEVTKNV